MATTSVARILWFVYLPVTNCHVMPYHPTSCIKK